MSAHGDIHHKVVVGNSKNVAWSQGGFHGSAAHGEKTGLNGLSSAQTVEFRSEHGEFQASVPMGSFFVHLQEDLLGAHFGDELFARGNIAVGKGMTESHITIADSGARLIDEAQRSDGAFRTPWAGPEQSFEAGAPPRLAGSEEARIALGILRHAGAI